MFGWKREASALQGGERKRGIYGKAPSHLWGGMTKRNNKLLQHSLVNFPWKKESNTHRRFCCHLIFESRICGFCFKKADPPKRAEEREKQRKGSSCLSFVSADFNTKSNLTLPSLFVFNGGRSVSPAMRDVGEGVHRILLVQY